MVYVQDHPDLERKGPTEAEVDNLGNDTYGWRQNVRGAGLMLVFVLPQGCSINPDFAGGEAAKVVDEGNRIAVYFMIEVDKEARVSVVWQLKRKVGDLRAEAEALNRAFYSAQAGYAAPGYVVIREPGPVRPARQTRVFVCYSHDDQDYKIQLLKYLKPLENDEGILFWHDDLLIGGDIWDVEIRQQGKTVQAFPHDIGAASESHEGA